MRQIKKGSTDISVVVRIVDSTDGTPETGVTSATAGLALEYRREGATSTALTESDLAALDSAHSDGGMKHIGNGYYRIDVPDAAFAAGANGVLIHGTATGMVVIGCYVHLVDYDPQDTVRLGLTALPNAAADAAGGLPISDAGGLDMDAILSRIGTPTNLGGGTATLAGNMQDIEAQTDDIGAAGAGLTAIPWNASWDAEVQSEVQDAIVVNNLDHVAPVSGSVTDASPTTTSFDTDLTSSDANHYRDRSLMFTSGTLANQSRIVTSSTTTGAVGFDKAWTRAPANGDTFIITSDHAHSETQLSESVWSYGSRTLTAFGFTVTASMFQDGWITAAKIATGAIDADAITADAVAEIADGVWDEARSGHVSAGSFGEYVLADTTRISGDATAADNAELAFDGTGYAFTGCTINLPSTYDFAKGTVAVTESYNTDGSAPTPVQALMLIMQALTEGAISGTTWTIKKLDGTTTAATITLDSATTPTSKTRAT